MSDKVLKPIIGLDSFYVAKLQDNTDTSTIVPSWDTPRSLKGAIKAPVNPNGSLTTLFFDNGAGATADTVGEIDLQIELADVSQEDYAYMFGHTIVGGMLIESPDDQSPYLAFGFRVKRDQNGYGYVWLLKGKFTKPQISYETKKEKVTFQTLTMPAKFVQTQYKWNSKGYYKVSTRDDATDYTATMGTNWFNSVQLPTTADTTAPTVTVVPADAATGVSVSANIVATFSEAIQAATINSANIVLLKTTDGTNVAGAITYDTAQEVVTFNPNSNLSSSTDYTFIITTGIKDIAGNALATPAVINFTTA